MTIDYFQILKSTPDAYLVLSTEMNILFANDAYLSATMTEMNLIKDRYLFDVFPDNPAVQSADGVSKLKASLDYVLENRKAHTMDDQQYDIPKSDGTFATRYWRPLNTPVFDIHGAISYIIHKVEDITEVAKTKTAMEERLKRQMAALEASEASLTQGLKVSESRFFKLFECSPVVKVITRLADGKIIMVNQMFENLVGITRNEILGKTVLELNIVSEKDRTEKIKEILLHGGSLKDHEFTLKTATGDLKCMLGSTELLELDSEQCLITAMLDISERRETEKQLVAANQFMDTILEHIPHMVFVKDAKELSVIRINQAGIDILGYDRHQLLGKRQMDLFPAEQAAFFREKDMEVFNTGKMVDIPEEPVQTSRGLRWMQTKKIPIFENGEPRYLIGISEDITERKQSQDDIKALNKELESFTYSVSHDLRAPLRAISGYAEMLAMDYEKVLDDEGLRLLGRVSHNAIKMGNLIDDLLSFSRLGRKKLIKSDTNLNNIVKEALSILQKNTPAKTTIKVNELHHAFTDSSLILQVMINLIGNAIKYSSKKELPVVELTSTYQDGAVIIEVKDNGAGFDMRYSDKLFNVFQRLHSSDEFEGTGVGLAIVQLIVNKHGGKAWANSQLNTATSFYVSLPIH